MSATTSGAIELVETVSEDIGLQHGDAQAIKQAMLAAVRDGKAGESTGSFHELALDVIAAFGEIDDAVFKLSLIHI